MRGTRATQLPADSDSKAQGQLSDAEYRKIMQLVTVQEDALATGEFDSQDSKRLEVYAGQETISDYLVVQIRDYLIYIEQCYIARDGNTVWLRRWFG